MTFPLQVQDIIADETVMEALRKAWQDSVPGAKGGHEEGGFVLLRSERLIIRRWPRGSGDQIDVPPHPGCVFDGCDIVATFHTHPNTGRDYLQEPGESDCRGVRDDPDLKGTLYVGEFVMADEMIYLVTPVGSVREIGARQKQLGGTNEWT